MHASQCARIPFDGLRLFDAVLGSALPARHVPAIDAFEADEEFLIFAEVPGMSREDLEIEAENGTLVLSGEKRLGEVGEAATRRLSERRGGRFRRSFLLPRYADLGAAEASLSDGVLRIRIPKAASARKQKVEIQG
jgi:HSP20 family protein